MSRAAVNVAVWGLDVGPWRRSRSGAQTLSLIWAALRYCSWNGPEQELPKSGHLSGKQMNADVVFHFTDCLYLANSFSRRAGCVLSCFNGSGRPQPFVANALFQY